MTPRLSVIVPTGDRAILLQRCLDQLVHQTIAEPFEVIVVDGGRRPLQLLRKASIYTPDRVEILRVDPATSIGERRNLAVQAARGELIAHFDDDDFYHRDYLDLLLQWWDTHQPVDLGGASQFWHYDVFRKRGWKTNLWDTGHPYGATFLYRKELWARLGGFQPLQRGEDQEFFLAVERMGGVIASLQDPSLYVYLRHHRNVTAPIDPIFHPQWTEATRAVMGDAVRFYDDLAELVNVPTIAEEGRQFHLPKNLRQRAP